MGHQDIRREMKYLGENTSKLAGGVDLRHLYDVHTQMLGETNVLDFLNFDRVRMWTALWPSGQRGFSGRSDGVKEQTMVDKIELQQKCALNMCQLSQNVIVPQMFN